MQYRSLPLRKVSFLQWNVKDFNLTLTHLRCRVVFKEEVKIIASAGTDQTNGSKTKTHPIPALVTTEKQKREIESLQKKHQISIAEIK